jgi:hypothetical protein
LNTRLGGIKIRELMLAKYGPDYFKELGRKGGNKTKATHDKDYYKRIRRAKSED